MIDTHCHLNFKAFTEDWGNVVERALEAGVTKMIVVGSNLENSRLAVEMASIHPTLYAAVGIHPHHAGERQEVSKLKTIAQNPKVVAIGETGLDKHTYNNQFENQKRLFEAHIQLAQEVQKPLILHSREAKEEVLEMVRDKGVRGTFHCFGGSKKYAKRILDAGFYIGFDGDVTYVPDRLAVATTIPLERLLLETDSPYLTPAPLRGQRNEPGNIPLLAKAHAEARNLTMVEIDTATTENANDLFKLD